MIVKQYKKSKIQICRKFAFHLQLVKYLKNERVDHCFTDEHRLSAIKWDNNKIDASNSSTSKNELSPSVTTLHFDFSVNPLIFY